MSKLRAPLDILNEEELLENISDDSENDESDPLEFDTSSHGYQMPISKQRAKVF